MILLQQIEPLQPLQPIEIDYAVLDIQMKLKTNIAWLSHSYGRAYRLEQDRTEKRLILPEVYVGNTEGKYSLMPVSPDNDKKAILFFVIDREKQLKFAQRASNYLTWDVGMVFWANLELINKDLSNTEDFTQLLIKDVRNVLTKNIIGRGYSVEIVDVPREFNEVFKEFSLNDRNYNYMPFTSFRFNIKITLKEECGLATNRGNALLNNITKAEICNIILPSLNFAGADFDCLTDQQKDDLMQRLILTE